MHCEEPPAITFIPCKDELLRTSAVENDFVMRSLKHWVKTLSQSEAEQLELSGEGQSGVIRLEELVRGEQQVRFQKHSIRALRCAIARILLGGSFRHFAALLADSPLLQCFCRVGQLDRVHVMRLGCLMKRCAKSLIGSCANQVLR